MRQSLPMIGSQSAENAGLLEIRAVEPRDFRRVAKILGLAILNEQHGAGSQIPTQDEWEARFDEPRLVATVGPQVLAWAATTEPEQPEADGARQLHLYIDPVAQGHGIESVLLAESVHRADAAKVAVLQAEVFDDQAGQVARLLEQGFTQVALRERAAQLVGLWRDVAVLARPLGG